MPDEARQGPVCVHLRTKKMYYREGTEDADPGSDTHPYFWCMLTMGLIGPDDGLAAARHCRPGRECYEDKEGDDA
jgi:hypothetical protein